MTPTPSPGNRRLHDARQSKIQTERARARTRLLHDPNAQDMIRCRAQEVARKTLANRRAVTKAQLELWAAEEEEEATHEEIAN